MLNYSYNESIKYEDETIHFKLFLNNSTMIISYCDGYMERKFESISDMENYFNDMKKSLSGLNVFSCSKRTFTFKIYGDKNEN